VRTVAIVTTSSPTSAEISGLPVADYVVFAEERAQDVDDGAYAVYVARELRYRLFVPPQATESARVPLVIWLHDEGESAEDSLALWKARLGDECAIAAIEAPYRETQEDLVEGGRWFWPDSFDSGRELDARGNRARG
jgi:poly(3-hydroxybutyrate) depolymerase